MDDKLKEVLALIPRVKVFNCDDNKQLVVFYYNDDKIHNDLSFLNDYLKDFPCTILFIREGKIRVEIELKPKEEVEIKWI